jgi:predicted nucleic acid-binding protein
LNVLVDTSVWVSHFKQANPQLVDLLEAGVVLCHPHVVVEIACGTPPHRQHVLQLLAQLDAAPTASHAELLALIARRRLHGRGCGFVDISLLAAALLASATLLWTLDKPLEALASDCGRAYLPLLQA